MKKFTSKLDKTIFKAPPKFLKHEFLEPDHKSLNLLYYIFNFKNRRLKANKIPYKYLKLIRCKMKAKYDQYAVNRNFKTGEKVLVLFPVAGKPLQAKYYGPYIVNRKVNEHNYIINTPDLKKINNTVI